MLRKIHFCLLAGLIFTPAFSQQRVVDYVNPIIGTNGMGHTFPGPCVPFGLIQLSPDTDTIPHNINGEYQKDVYKYCAGYQYSDPTIVGFSHTHLSGTGHSDLGDILIMPTVGELKLNFRMKGIAHVIIMLQNVQQQVIMKLCLMTIR